MPSAADDRTMWGSSNERPGESGTSPQARLKFREWKIAKHRHPVEIHHVGGHLCTTKSVRWPRPRIGPFDVKCWAIPNGLAILRLVAMGLLRNWLHFASLTCAWVRRRPLDSRLPNRYVANISKIYRSWWLD